ncbi:MAG: hypothetical protein KatS3mg076_2620 [Candidatus Binatia bacterium]|nr:MAG: hypothetical protein KatS3mg076_2620 [Candidatus Binatia bacterium]
MSFRANLGKPAISAATPSVLSLLSTLLFCLAAGARGETLGWAYLGLVLCSAAAAALRARASLLLALFSLLFSTLPAPGASGLGAPRLFVALSATFLLSLPFAQARPLLRRTLRAGRIDAKLLAISAALGCVFSVATAAWLRLSGPEFLPKLPVAGTGEPFSSGLLAAANAAIEEITFRGFFLACLRASGVGSATSVLAQAIAFGASHVEGIPSGPLGVSLAFLFGLATGALRERSGGILSPWFAHFLVDLFAFLFLLRD